MKSVYSTNFKYKITTNLHGQTLLCKLQKLHDGYSNLHGGYKQKKLVANWTEMSFIASYGGIQGLSVLSYTTLRKINFDSLGNAKRFCDF